MGEGGGGEEKGRFLSFSSLPRFHLSPFPPETPDTQATNDLLWGGCHSDNLNVPACNKCVRIKSRESLLSLIGEPYNSKLRIYYICITCLKAT